jgi:hypothetical protein
MDPMSSGKRHGAQVSSAECPLLTRPRPSGGGGRRASASGRGPAEATIEKRSNNPMERRNVARLTQDGRTERFGKRVSTQRRQGREEDWEYAEARRRGGNRNPSDRPHAKREALRRASVRREKDLTQRKTRTRTQSAQRRESCFRSPRGRSSLLFDLCVGSSRWPGPDRRRRENPGDRPSRLRAQRFGAQVSSEECPLPTRPRLIGGGGRRALASGRGRHGAGGGGLIHNVKQQTVGAGNMGRAGAGVNGW